MAFLQIKNTGIVKRQVLSLKEENNDEWK